jgi:hypothetical protein
MSFPDLPAGLIGESSFILMLLDTPVPDKSGFTLRFNKPEDDTQVDEGIYSIYSSCKRF